MLERYGAGIIRYRWLVIFLSLMAVVAGGSGLTKLAFTNDYRAFFADENPQLQAFDELQNTYDKSDNVLIIVAPKEGSVFEPKTLAQIEWLTEEAWQTPYSNRVDSITNFQHTRAYEDDLDVADLITDAESLTQEDLDYVAKVSQGEPQLRQRLISPDGRATGVNVNIQLPGKALTEVPEVAAFVRDLAAQLEARDPNLKVHLSGLVMLNNAFGESAQKDMATLIPLMFLVVIVVLGILLRSAIATAVSTFVIFFSIIIAMGLYGTFGEGTLTGMEISTPTIILTMAVADCVHLLVTFFWSLRHGKSKNDAIIEMLRVNMLPIFLTSVTTAIGFLSMNFSEAPPIQHLGNIVATGVTIAFILSVTFLPAVIAVMPFKTTVANPDDVKKNWTYYVANFVIAKRNPLLIGTAIFTALMVTMVPKNEINDEFVKYFDKSMDFRQASDFAAENLIGAYTLEYSLSLKEPVNPAGEFYPAATLATAKQTVQALVEFQAKLEENEALLNSDHSTIVAELNNFAAALEGNYPTLESLKYHTEETHLPSLLKALTDDLKAPLDYYTTLDNIDYVLDASHHMVSEEGRIADPFFLQKVESFVEYLETVDEVAHIFSLSDTMKRLNKNMHGDDEAWYKTPENRELAAQYLLLYELSLPYGLDLNNQIDVSKSATRITVTIDNVSSNTVLRFEKEWAEWLETNTPELAFSAASANIMFSHIGYRNAKSLTFGTVIALVLISGILVGALRSLKLGGISLVPNLVPAGIAFGIWGLVDGNVGMSVSVVVGMTLGIVVDDTVHFLSKYLRARREKGLSAEDAIRYAFEQVGNALVITTVVLVAGFSMLIISTFKMNSDMGLLTAITITTALLVDFFLLPPLLLLFDKDKPNTAPQNA